MLNKTQVRGGVPLVGLEVVQTNALVDICFGGILYQYHLFLQRLCMGVIWGRFMRECERFVSLTCVVVKFQWYKWYKLSKQISDQAKQAEIVCTT